MCLRMARTLASRRGPLRRYRCSRRACHARYRLDAGVLAGGCAVNSVANGKVLTRSPFKRLYVQSAAGDAGGAIGAAFVVWNQLQGKADPSPLHSPLVRGGEENPRGDGGRIHPPGVSGRPYATRTRGHHRPRRFAGNDCHSY